MMNKPRYFITDVFTSKRYGGNPLATFIDCESLSDLEMQQIAKEINFSETTFIASRQPRDGGFDVRIFTPNAEDAATGSSNGALAAYLVRHKVFGEAVIDCTVGQGYELGRPSALALRASDSNGVIDVSVGGSVAEVAEGVWG